MVAVWREQQDPGRLQRGWRRRLNDGIVERTPAARIEERWHPWAPRHRPRLPASHICAAGSEAARPSSRARWTAAPGRRRSCGEEERQEAARAGGTPSAGEGIWRQGQVSGALARLRRPASGLILDKMQGRLKLVTFQSSQEQWKIDFPEISAPSAHGAPRPTEPRHHRIPISEAKITPPDVSRAAPPKKANKRSSTSSDPVMQVDDDDDFMPRTKQPSCARDSTNMSTPILRKSMGHSTSMKVPNVRCDPSLFNKFTEFLTMDQYQKICDLGFAGLLVICLDIPDTSDLVIYLMNKLNPDTMILEIGNEGGLAVNELSVWKVFHLPIGDMDPPCGTEDQNSIALDEFRKLVYVDRNKDVKCRHLLHLMKSKIDNELAVRIFFIAAMNKLLLPAVDNNIRGQDAFMTKDFSQFASFNWCKAVVHELRHAAMTWHSDKKRSILGCALFLIIFYLDNLDSRNSIDHFGTPRVKFFGTSVIEKIILEDKRKDRFGNDTYGNLPLRNFAKTCYRYSETHPNGASAAAGSSSTPIFPGAEQIGVLLSGILSKPLRNMAADAMKQFHTRSTEAINLIQSGSQMLVDAHNNFVRTMQCVQEKETKENRRRDHERRDDGQCMDDQQQAAA